MAKVSLYLNKHLKFLVKTNMDLQERQEEALDSNLKSKHIKEINSKNKEIEENINNLKLEEFDEKNMTTMFQNCNELEYLDLSNFNPSNALDISFMFNNCYKLKFIIGIDNFNSIKILYSFYFF